MKTDHQNKTDVKLSNTEKDENTRRKEEKIVALDLSTLYAK